MTFIVVGTWSSELKLKAHALRENEAEAQKTVEALMNHPVNPKHGAFYAQHPGVDPKYIKVDPNEQTVSIDADAVRADKLAALAVERWRRQVAGYTHPADGLTYHSDPEGRQSLNEAITLARDYEAAAGADTWSTDWKAADGWTAMDLPKLLAVARGVAGMVQGLFVAERVHAEALAQLTDPAEIAAYDVTTDWPG